MDSPINHLSPFNSPVNNQLPRQLPINYNKDDQDKDDDKINWADLSFTNTNCQYESKELMKLGIPIGFSLATRLLQYFTDQSMVGHLGTDYLAASSLAGILMTIFATYIYSFCGTINVLCSQAYAGGNTFFIFCCCFFFFVMVVEVGRTFECNLVDVVRFELHRN